MTTLLDKMIQLINTYRRKLRSEEPRSLVTVVDENMQPTDMTRSEVTRPHLPDIAEPASDMTDIRTRSTPDTVSDYNPIKNEGPDPSTDLEIDLSRDDQFEAYATGMKIPQKTLEKWIAAGILCPDEIRAAEKLLKMIREKSKQQPNL